jgi:hypothetical protein
VGITVTAQVVILTIIVVVIKLLMLVVLLLVLLLQHLLLLLVQAPCCCPSGDPPCGVSHSSQACSCHSRNVLQQHKAMASRSSSHTLKHRLMCYL